MAITVTNTAEINTYISNQTTYTVSAWAKFQADQSLMLYANGGVGDGLIINNGVATLRVQGVDVTGSVPADNAWHHVALVRTDANTALAYIDGVLLLTNTTVGYLPVFKIVFVAYPSKTNQVAHLIAVGRAMTATEITAQAASYYPLVAPLFWLPFFDAATLLIDYSGNGLTTSNIGGGSYAFLADPAYPLPDPPIVAPDATVAPANAPTYTPTAQTITLGTQYNTGAIWIDVEDNAGNKLGSGPLQALRWTATARIDAAGKFSCEILANDPQVSQIQKRRVLRAWTAINGVIEEIGAGIVDSITTTINADSAPTLTIAGDDLLRELAWRSMQGQRLAYQSGGAWVPVTHRQAVTLLDYYMPSTWTFYAAPAPANDSIYGQFVGESVLQAAVAVAKLTRTHFYRGTGRTLIFASNFYDSGMAATNMGGELRPEICAIQELAIEEQSYDLIGRIYPYGAGTGAARLTLAAATRTAPAGYMAVKPFGFIEHTATVATYGQAVAYVQWPDITPISNTDTDVQNAANALFDAALEYLRDRTERAYPTYRISLAQCSRLLRPTQTIRVTYRDAVAGINIDATLNILETTIQIDADGLRTTGIVVSAGERWPDSDAKVVAQAIQGGKQYQAHPQLNANAYVLPFSKNLDDDQSNPANFRFRFDAEVTQISRVTFDFQLLPLESTVKSVGGSSTTTAANGDHTHTVTVAAHSHNVTVAAHSHNVTVSGHQHTVPNHTHYIAITGGSAPTYPIGYGAAGTAGGLVHNASGSTHNYPTNSNSGSVTSNSGGSINQSSADGGSINQSSADGGSINQSSADGGSINQSSAGGGSHSHTLTPTITTVYGVYRDSAGNTFAVTDLEYSLDGSTWYNFAAGVNGYESLGDGWYRVDLTTLLQAVNSYRPKAANNLLRIRRKTAGAAKKATIDAQLNVRTIIQALALT